MARDSAAAQHAEALARLEKAHAALAEAQKKSGEEVILNKQAAVAAAKAEVEGTRAELDRVKAEISSARVQRGVTIAEAFMGPLQTVIGFFPALSAGAPILGLFGLLLKSLKRAPTPA